VPFVFSDSPGVAPPRYNVNLPVASPAGSIAYMLLGQDFLIDLELSAAQAEGRGEVISTPRVITANQREASIEQGVEIPYQESASSGATTISFKKAVLALKVTPQVTPDNRIILDLNVKKDSVGQVIVGGAGQQVPSIDTREITTQVLVNDGQTVVLGGILETERRFDRLRPPSGGRFISAMLARHVAAHRKRISDRSHGFGQDGRRQAPRTPDARAVSGQ
jgi:type IV pilus assembly protein PilQ